MVVLFQQKLQSCCLLEHHKIVTKIAAQTVIVLVKCRVLCRKMWRKSLWH